MGQGQPAENRALIEEEEELTISFKSFLDIISTLSLIQNTDSR